ncbi:ACP phosphodiesterase [Escherichia coli]
MNFLAHLHLAHLAESSLSGNLLADFVRGNPEEVFRRRRGWHSYASTYRRITDDLPEVREARERLVVKLARCAYYAGCNVGSLSFRHRSQLSPDFPLQEICLLCPRASDDGFCRTHRHVLSI